MAHDRSSESACPPEDDLLAFSSGDVSDAVRATVIGHLAWCDECRIITSELSRERLGHAATATPDFAREPSTAQPIPRSPSSPPERGSRPSFAPGETIAGKFEVVRVLGSGGMGVVVEARHLLLEQRVALKFMGPLVASDPEATRRFLREARAAAQIPSEHVVRILDVATLDDGAPYIVMERLEGADLATVLEREGRLEPARAVGYLMEAMEALAHAHAKGIVHRDLKPANLFLATRDDGARIVKVLDFGIAKAQEEAGSPGMTTSHTVLGSPRYMAPEQMQSAKDVDMRADVWALGTILFELVAGRPAFVGDTLAALTVAICTGEKPRLSDALPSVDAGLSAAVAGCLERGRETRTADVAELARALAPLGPPSARGSLERIVAVLASSARPPQEPVSRGGSVPPVSVRDQTPVGSSGSARRIGVAAALFGAVALGGGIYVGLGPSKASEPRVTTADATPAPSSLPVVTAEPSSSTPAPLASSAPRPVIGVPVALPPAVGPKKPAPSASVSAPPLRPALPPSASPYDERK